MPARKQKHKRGRLICLQLQEVAFWLDSIVTAANECNSMSPVEQVAAGALPRRFDCPDAADHAST